MSNLLTTHAVNGWVYIVADGAGLYKIGYTKGDPKRRLASIQTGASLSLTLVHAMQADWPSVIERLLHCHFDARRVHGEWFRLTADDVASIQNGGLTPDWYELVALEPKLRRLRTSALREKIVVAGLPNRCHAEVRVRLLSQLDPLLRGVMRFPCVQHFFNQERVEAVARKELLDFSPKCTHRGSCA